MPAAGWYDDPAGTPRTYRYWVGSSWSRETTTNPSDPAPGSPPRPASRQPVPPPGATVLPPSAQPRRPVQPEPRQPEPRQPEPRQPEPRQPEPRQPEPRQPESTPAPGGPPSYAAGPGTETATGPEGRRVWLTVAVVAAAVLLVAGIGVGAFVVSGRIGDDRPSDDRSTAAESDDGTEQSTTRPAEDLDCDSGDPEPDDPQTGARRIVGGGISMPRVPGYTIDVAQSEPFEFATSFTPQVKVIEKDPTGGWVSVYGVSGLDTGYGTPEEAAEVVMACMADSSTLYSDFTRRKDLDNDEFEVDGADSAWLLKSELHVDNPDLDVTGDLAYVVVVDTGDEDEYGLYISVVPLGATRLAAQQKRVSGQLTVP